MCVCVPQEYEEKLARVQADYTAEKQCKVKLQEDITALQSTFESKLARLEEERTQRTGKTLHPAFKQGGDHYQPFINMTLLLNTIQLFGRQSSSRL